MDKKILVVAPHPDDESFGVGGSLLKHAKNGDQVYWLIMTTVASHPNYSEKFQINRAEQIKAVSLMYGMQNIFQLPFFAAKLDRHPLSEVIQAVSSVVENVEPNILYLPFAHDVHSDHRITFEAAFSCTKIFRHQYIEEVLVYETLSETEFSPMTSSLFSPTVFVDITDYFDKKKLIIKQYESELREHPFPRNLELIGAQAMLRGAQCGAHFAEAFMLLKRRW